MCEEDLLLSKSKEAKKVKEENVPTINTNNSKTKEDKQQANVTLLEASSSSRDVRKLKELHHQTPPLPQQESWNDETTTSMSTETSEQSNRISLEKDDILNRLVILVTVQQNLDQFSRKGKNKLPVGSKPFVDPSEQQKRERIIIPLYSLSLSSIMKTAHPNAAKIKYNISNKHTLDEAPPSIVSCLSTPKQWFHQQQTSSTTATKTPGTSGGNCTTTPEHVLSKDYDSSFLMNHFCCSSSLLPIIDS